MAPPYKHMWSTDKVLKLIKYLEKYKFLWNTKEKEFYDLKLKADTISEMAEKLQVEVFEAYRKINEIKRKISMNVKYFDKVKYFQEECRFLYEWYLENEYEVDVNHDEILFDLIIEHDVMLLPRSTKKIAEEKEKAWTIILEKFKKKTHLPCVNLVYLKFIFKNLLKRTSARMKKFLSNYYSNSLKCIPTEFEKKVVQFMPSMLLTDADMLKECVGNVMKIEDSQGAADISEGAMDEDTLSNMIDLTSCMSDDERSHSPHTSLTFPDDETSRYNDDDSTVNRNMDYLIYDLDNQTYSELSEETLDRIETEAFLLKSVHQKYSKVTKAEKLALIPLLLPKILSKQTYADVFANSNISIEEMTLNPDLSFWSMISSEFDDLGMPVAAKTLKLHWNVIIDGTRKCQDALYNSIDLRIQDETTFWSTLSMFPLLFCTDILEQVDDEENSINQNQRWQNNISNMTYSDSYTDSTDNLSMEFPEGLNKSDLVRHPKPIKLPDRAEVIEMNRRLQTASVSPTIASERVMNRLKKSAVNWYPNKKFVQKPSWMTKPIPVPTSNEPVKVFYKLKEVNDKNVQEAYSNFVHVVNTVSNMLSNTRKPAPEKLVVVAEDTFPSEPEAEVKLKRTRKPRQPKLGKRKYTKRKLLDTDYKSLKRILYPETSLDSDSLSRLSIDSQESAVSVPFRDAESPTPLNIDIPENLSERSNAITTDSAPELDNTISNVSSQSKQTNSAEYQYSLTINPLVATDNTVSLSYDSSQSEQIDSGKNQYSLTINPLVAPDNIISLSNDSSQSEWPNTSENQYSFTINPPVVPDNSMSNVTAQSEQTNLVETQPPLSLDQAPIIENLGSFDQFKDVLDILSFNNIDPNSITVLNAENGESIPQLSIPDSVNASCAKLGDGTIQISQPVSLEKSGNNTESILKHLLQVGNHSGSEEILSYIIDKSFDDQNIDSSTPPIQVSGPQSNLQPFDSAVLVESAKSCNIDLRSYYSMIADSLEDNLNAQLNSNVTGVLYPVNIVPIHTSPPKKKKVIIKKFNVKMSPKQNLPIVSFKVPVGDKMEKSSPVFDVSKNSPKHTHVVPRKSRQVSPVKTSEKNIAKADVSEEMELPVIIDVTGNNSVKYNLGTTQNMNKKLSPVKTPDKNINKNNLLKKIESPESQDEDLVLVLDDDSDSEDSSAKTPIVEYGKTSKQQSNLSDNEKFIQFLMTKFKAHKNLQSTSDVKNSNSPLLEDNLVLVDEDENKATKKSPARIIRPRKSKSIPGEQYHENKECSKKPIKTFVSKKKTTSQPKNILNFSIDTESQGSNTKKTTRDARNLDINSLLSNADSPLLQDDFVLVLQRDDEKKALKETSERSKNAKSDRDEEISNSSLSEGEVVSELEDDCEENALKISLPNNTYSKRTEKHRYRNKDIVSEEANSPLLEVLESEDELEEGLLNESSQNTSDSERFNIHKRKSRENDVAAEEANSPLIEVLESEDEFEESLLNESSESTRFDIQKHIQSDQVAERANASLSEDELVLRLEDDSEETALKKSSSNTSHPKGTNKKKSKNRKCEREVEKANSSLSEDELVLRLEEDSEENAFKESSSNTSHPRGTNTQKSKNPKCERVVEIAKSPHSEEELVLELEDDNEGKDLKISTQDVKTLENSVVSEIETCKDKQFILSKNAEHKKSKKTKTNTSSKSTLDILKSTKSLKADIKNDNDSKLSKSKSKGNADSKKQTNKKSKNLKPHNQETILLQLTKSETKPSESPSIYESSDEDDIPLAVQKLQPDQSDEDDIPLVIKKLQPDQSDDDIPLVVKTLQPDQSDDDIPLAVTKLQPDQSDEDDIPLAVKKLQPDTPTHTNNKDGKKFSQNLLHTVKKKKSLIEVGKPVHDSVKNDSSSQKSVKVSSKKRKSLTEVDKSVHDSLKDDGSISQKSGKATSKKKISLTNVDNSVKDSVKDDASFSQESDKATSKKRKYLTEVDKSVRDSLKVGDSISQKSDKATSKKRISLTKLDNSEKDSFKDDDSFSQESGKATSKKRISLTKVDNSVKDSVKDDDSISQESDKARSKKRISLTQVDNSVKDSVKDDDSFSQESDKATSRKRKSLTEVDKSVHDSLKDDDSISKKSGKGTSKKRISLTKVDSSVKDDDSISQESDKARSKKRISLTQVDNSVKDSVKDDDSISQESDKARSKKRISLTQVDNSVKDSVKDDDSISQESDKATSRKRKSSSIEDDRVISESIFRDVKMPKTALKSDKNTDGKSGASPIKKKVNFLLSSESSDEDVPLSIMKKPNKKLTKKSNKS